ncbi:MAG: 30S ribosomal protein S4e [Candidatus Methanomethylicota archaeon]|uniref:Small ribosomal subunit protein eS4 n=1 Tax=Thermoproteota archaeon TaxID=2056631 RepID=A0A497EQC0_9CREN|nr:MAG: 30S ribosomal protein S4e [Candidatus Verstraetearchaeota archaeon]
MEKRKARILQEVISLSHHLKTYPAPRFWPILRKEKEWTVKPRPGPHPQDRSIPLAIILRDILKYAETMKEVKKILAERKVLVDRVVRKDYKFPVGLMDVISLPDAKKNFRVLPHSTYFLTLVEIPDEEANFKLCRIENKTTVKRGNIQLNLHDGRNLLIRVNDPFNPVEDTYSTLDVLKLSLPDGKLLETFKLEKGAWAIIIGGENVGRYGVIEEISDVGFKRKNLVTIRLLNGEKAITIMDYIFVIGRDSPIITLPEGG